METFIDDNFMTVFEENWILTLLWKENTINLTGEDFKKQATKYVAIVERKNSKKIIVDMRKFLFNLEPEIISWRNENIISIYNDIWVEKFAFITEKESVNQDNPNNTFITKDFLTKQEAESWLNS